MQIKREVGTVAEAVLLQPQLGGMDYLGTNEDMWALNLNYI